MSRFKFRFLFVIFLCTNLFSFLIIYSTQTERLYKERYFPDGTSYSSACGVANSDDLMRKGYTYTDLGNGVTSLSSYWTSDKYQHSLNQQHPIYLIREFSGEGRSDHSVTSYLNQASYNQGHFSFVNEVMQKSQQPEYQNLNLVSKSQQGKLLDSFTTIVPEKFRDDSNVFEVDPGFLRDPDDFFILPIPERPEPIPLYIPNELPSLNPGDKFYGLSQQDLDRINRKNAILNNLSTQVMEESHRSFIQFSRNYANSQQARQDAYDRELAKEIDKSFDHYSSNCAACKERYGVCPSCINKMFGWSSDNFINKIVENLAISNEALIELFRAYERNLWFFHFYERNKLNESWGYLHKKIDERRCKIEDVKNRAYHVVKSKIGISIFNKNSEQVYDCAKREPNSNFDNLVYDLFVQSLHDKDLCSSKGNLYVFVAHDEFIYQQIQDYKVLSAGEQFARNNFFYNVNKPGCSVDELFVAQQGLRVLSHLHDKNCSTELASEINNFCNDVSNNCASIKSLNCLSDPSIQNKIERLDQKIDAYKEHQSSIKSHTIANSD